MAKTCVAHIIFGAKNALCSHLEAIFQIFLMSKVSKLFVNKLNNTGNSSFLFGSCDQSERFYFLSPCSHIVV